MITDLDILENPPISFRWDGFPKAKFILYYKDKLVKVHCNSERQAADLSTLLESCGAGLLGGL